MAADLISEVVSSAALKQVTDLTALLQSLDITLVSNIKNAVSLNESLAGTKGFTDLKTGATQAAAAIGEVTTATKAKAIADADATALLTKLGGTLDANVKQLVQQKTELALVTEQQKLLTKEVTSSTGSVSALTAKQAELTKQSIILKNTISQTNQAINAQVKETIAAETSNTQLNLTLTRLRASYDGLSIAERENVAVGGVLLKEIQSLDATTKAAAASQGVYNKEVGNYAIAGEAASAGSKKLENTLERVTSGSNFVATAIGRVYRQVIGLALGFGAAFLVEPVINFISSLDIFKDKLDQIKVNLAAYNEVTKEASENAGKQIADSKILYEAATNTNNSLKDRLAYGNELIKLYPEEFKGIDALTIANGDAKDSYDALTKSIIENAKATAAKSKIEKLEAERLELEFKRDKINIAATNQATDAKGNLLKGLNETQQSSVLKGQQGRGLATVLSNITDEKNKSQLDVNNQISSIDSTEAFLTKFAGGGKPLADSVVKGDKKKGSSGVDDTEINSQIETQKKMAEVNKAIANDDKVSYDARIVALKIFSGTEDKIAELQVQKATKDGLSKKAINDELSATLIKNKLDTDKIAEKIEEDEVKRTKANNDEISKEIQENLRKEIEARKEAIVELIASFDKEKEQKLLALSEQYAAGLIDEKTYQDQKNAITEFYTEKSLEAQIEAQKRLIVYEALNGKDATEEAKKLVELENKLENDKVNAKIKANEKKTASDKQLHDKEIELANDVVGLVKSAVDATYQNRIDALKKQSDAIDINTKSQIDAESRSLDSAATKADKIKVIEAKATAQKQVLANKERDIKVQQAKFDKAISITGIIENTAVAISKTLAEGGILFSPLVGVIAAIGAVQLAAVLAQPIPAFEKGGITKTKNFIAGEKGEELMISPGGNYSLTPATATYMSAPIGTQILDHKETMRILARPEPINFTGAQTLNTEQMEFYLKEINKAVHKQPSQPPPPKSEPFGHRWNDYVRGKVN